MADRALRLLVLVSVVMGLVASLWLSASGAQEPSLLEVSTVSHSFAEPTDVWVTYMNTDYGFSLQHPANWTVDSGNGHAPSLPGSIVTLQSERATFDVTIIPLHNGAGYDGLRITQRAAAGFWGDLPKMRATTKDIGTLRVARSIYVQPSAYSTAVQLVLTTFTGHDSAYILLTQAAIDPISGLVRSQSYSDRLAVYEKIVESFIILHRGPQCELPAVPTTPESGLYEGSAGTRSLKATDAVFQWPTDGYVGYIYRRPVSYAAYHNGIDIWTNRGGSGNQGSKGNAVYPPYSGRVSWVYTDPDGVQQGVRVEHGSVDGTKLWTHYWHMADEYTGQSYIEAGLLGQQVDTNRLLGYQGNRRWNRWGDIIVHLHLTLANGSADSNDIDPSPYFGTELNWNDPEHIGWHHYVERTSHPTCPSSGGVILYKDANYDCGGEGEGRGYVRRDSTGLQDYVGDDFNDQASSVRVPSGWSVKLYEHENGRGDWACRTEDDPNFWGDDFNGGTGLNDKVTSFEVFHDSRCGEPENRAPNRPSPRSPRDGHPATDGRAPSLCWDNRGDPDGDRLEFYAEVYDSPDNANSGWRSDTCWWPTELDGHYHDGYKWRVRARDSEGARSDWSDTWHFDIKDPNQPPSISFDTANGSSSGRIESRDRDWIFRGTAHDREGRLSRIEFRCSGDDCGRQTHHEGLDNWRHDQADMAGKNDVYFVAFDDKHSTGSRHLDLNIDLAPPRTSVSLNGERNPAGWPTWFTEPVEVRLRAADESTGRARVGVREINYRLDGGAWQTHSGDDKRFTVSDDGSHTVEYYAVDRVGNQEATRSVTFKVDRTPPDPPSGITETHGVVSNQWQKDCNTPTFTWAVSSDASSGLAYYQFYFGTEASGEGYKTFRATDPREWTPLPGGVRTGSYYLRGRTRDNAGNWSAWTDLFTFRYDGTPPENPEEATHTAGITNDTWQRITNLADFTWPPAYDEGSGMKGYLHYWGADPEGTSTDFASANSFQSATPLCGENQACTGYLRLRSVDNVDNQAEEWSTAFVLRYDNAPPTAAFTFRGGITETGQTLVTLDIAAVDEGSGVREMRLSGDGRNWAPWEVYATERVWEIPGISRQSWPIYLQVKDGVGLESEVISHTVYLDVNRRQPRSANFRLFDRAMSAGAGEHTSSPSGYTGHSTVGQVMNSTQVGSLRYTIVGGYEAGSQAIPIIEPGHDEFTFINGIFASGTGANTLTSVLYQMVSTVGEIGLPNNETTLNSSGFQHQPGFLAAAPPAGTPTPTPIPGPTPTPEPTPACEFPLISIDDGALFTNDTQVTLNICAPRAVEMMISNDGGFGEAEWESYAESKAWTITTYGQHVLPRFVYAAFKDSDGTVHGTYFDDIIHDPNAPSGTVSVGDSVPGEMALGRLMTTGALLSADEPILVGSTRYVRRLGDTLLDRPIALYSTQSDGSVDLYFNAQDDNSGLSEMQVSASAAFTDITWETYSALKPWIPEGGDGIKTVYVRFRDAASNASQTVTDTFALDTLPPIGGLFIDQRVVGPDTITTTVYLGAEDNLSGVADVRVSALPDFSDAPWQVYTASLTWPISITEQTDITLYAQYRDLAGNASEVYTDTCQVDTTPPVMYVAPVPGDGFTRTVTVLAYDELAAVETMRLSNDPLMIEGVVTLPYTTTVEWTFDDHWVIWVQLEDSVGNVTEPYPAYGGESVTDISLVPGWNFIALPVSPASTVITDVLSTIDGSYDLVYAYHASDVGDPWKKYNTAAPAFLNDLTEIDETMGLWVRITDPATQTLRASGTALCSMDLPLYAGWNLAGYPMYGTRPISEALASVDGKYDLVYAYDASDVADPWKKYNVAAPPFLNDLTDMGPGRAYWIRVSEDCRWTLP